MKSKLLSIVWSIAVLACGVLFILQIQKGIRIESDILKLLPADRHSKIVDESSEHFMREVAHRVFILLKASTFEESKTAAEMYADILTRSSLYDVASVQRHDADTLKILYEQHIENLLSDSLMEELQAVDSVDKIVQKIHRTLAAPFLSSAVINLSQDPLLILPQFLTALPKPPGKVVTKEGYDTVTIENEEFIVLTAILNGNVFNQTYAQQAIDVLHSAKSAVAEKISNLQVIQTGALQFAQAMAQSAQRDVTVIGIGSTVLLTLLVWMTFKSTVPLLFSCLTVSVGLLFSVTLSLFFFSSLHILTLGFGATLIGVCADYSFHFFCHQYSGSSKSSEKIIKVIHSGLFLGVMSGIAGYAGMFFVPFPGLNQMAFFAVAGMIASYLCVVSWARYLPSRKTTKDAVPWLLRASKRWLRFYATPKAKKLFAYGMMGASPLIIWGISSVKINDEVRSLQKMPPALVKEEQRLRQYLGDIDTSRFILVTGENEEDVLSKQQGVSLRLETFKAEGKLQQFYALRSFIPSIKTQQKSFEVFQNFINQNKESLSVALSALGFKTEVIKEFLEKPRAFSPLTMADMFQAMPSAKHMQSLWGQSREGIFRSMIAVSGLKSSNDLAILSKPSEGIFAVDLIKDPSDALAKNRFYMTIVLAVCYLGIYLFFISRYGFFSGTLGMMPGALGIVLTLAALGILGHPVTLFTVLANAIVLGLAVDYSIFLLEGGESEGPSMMAIILSAVSTMCSFGLLAFSQTAVLQSFGISLFIGITVAVLFAPFVLHKS